ncbi:MAG: CBS domain-containing protein [Desulfomonile tiedjei]|nr:CBS domain-containing protein [Desulfomonile tiedjei]
MLVRDWMSKNVITIESTEPMQQAINLLMEHHVGMLPVMEEGKLVGIVTDRDLKRASPSDATLMDIQHVLYHLSRLEVGAIMSRYPITIPDEFTMEEAAEVLLNNGISGAPCLDKDGRITGVITKNDMFKAFIALSGLAKRGVLFGFLLEDRPGSIKDVTDLIRKYNARLVSILTSYEKAPEGYRYVYIRAHDVNRETLPQLEQELKQTAKLLYKVDHRANTRAFYDV